MVARTNLCGGSSPRVVHGPVRLDTADRAMLASAILRSLPATRANLALASSPLIDGVSGGKADPEEAAWRAKAADPRNVCVERDGEISIAQVGDEPKGYRDWLVKARRGELGCGGRGFVLVDLFGEGAITHNLWSPEAVPARFAPLFRITHVRVERLTDAQERACWARFDPFRDESRPRVA